MKNFFVLLLGIIIGAAIVYFFYCREDLSDAIVEPKGLITPAEANVLDKAYNNRHRLISDSIVRRPDNRSSWYSVSDVRDYLKFAEDQAKDLGYTLNGIRVYLGAYPDTANEIGYTTMFFIPTGNLTESAASISPFDFFKAATNSDIPGASGLDMGSPGNPPAINYPQ